MSELISLHLKARRHLARHDPVLKPLIASIGACTLQPGGDGFVVLVRSIVSQMISTAAASSISRRVELAAGPDGITPASMLALGEPRIREQGLSTAKAKAILDLATRSQEGTLPLAEFPDLPDEQVIAHLTAVRGIGVWTAEMFLIFCLGRTDVLPVGDFGLRSAVQNHFGLEAMPGAAQLKCLAEPWRPYRSIATWYLWRSKGGVPQS